MPGLPPDLLPSVVVHARPADIGHAVDGRPSATVAPKGRLETLPPRPRWGTDGTENRRLGSWPKIA